MIGAGGFADGFSGRGRGWFAGRRAGGSVTVFLALTMLVIMALLGTMVEVTRGKVCRIHGRRTLRTAVDSLMTEYSRPLFEKYRLFFLEDVGKPFRESVAEYAASTLTPDRIGSGYLDFYDGALSDVTVDKKRYAGDDGGIALLEQISAYMGRSLAADAVEDLLQKTKSTGELDEAAEKIDQRVTQEREAAEDSRDILKLMWLIDGVDCSGGRVKGQQVFVKMFHHGKKRPERFGISEPRVWEVMKKNIVELQVYFSRIGKNAVLRQQFLRIVRQAAEKTKEALEIAKRVGVRLKQYSVSGDAEGVLASDLSILEQSEAILSEAVTDQSLAELKRLWKKYNTSGIVFDYAGINEKGGEENPMRSFSDAISGGVAKLVLKESGKVSKKSVASPDRYRELHSDDRNEKKEDSERLKAFAEDGEVKLAGAVKGIAKLAATDVMVCEYLKKYFSSAVRSVGNEKKRLNYEWEYMIGGKKSDKKNLDEVINRLVLLRSVINITALLSSSEKRETAYAAALAIVGFTGMEPLIRLTQTLLLVLWGTVESLVDVAALLQSKKVPLVKTAKDIVVTFPELYQVSNRYIMKKVDGLPQVSARSFGYPEHLMLLMAGTRRADRCYRMMDLIEWNIRDNDVSEFNFGGCVDSFEVTGKFSFATKFFRFPQIQNVIDRELNHFQQGITVEAGYLRQLP